MKKQHKLYLAGIGDASIQDIQAFVGEVGFTAAHVDLILDRETGRNRGFCFVTLDAQDDLTAAVERLDGLMLRARKITVRVALPRGARDFSDGAGML